MKRSTVDLVVTGDERAAVIAAVDAVRRGQRVLVVLRSDDGRVVGRLRRLCRAARSQLTVMTNAEVVCVDGVDGVEAVVVRYTRTGRLCAVNTPAFLSSDGSGDRCTERRRNFCGGGQIAVRSNTFVSSCYCLT
jgi:thioredoxin reductase